MFTTKNPKNKTFTRFGLKVFLFLTIITLYAVPAVQAAGAGSPTPTGC